MMHAFFCFCRKDKGKAKQVNPDQKNVTSHPCRLFSERIPQKHVKSRNDHFLDPPSWRIFSTKHKPRDFSSKMLIRVFTNEE